MSTVYDPIELLHHQAYEQTRRGHAIALSKYIQSLQPDPRRVLANEVEHKVAWLIEGLGYRVIPTTHKAHYDLLACNDHTAMRVEVKASTWHQNRFDFQLRDNQADVLILCCRNGKDSFFVIPFDKVQDIGYLKITTYHADEYTGKWFPYYEAWDTLKQISGVNAWQIPMPLE